MVWGVNWIYLDHAATAPPSEKVVAAVADAMRRHWANPSSPHAAGRHAAGLVAEARKSVANMLGTTPGRVVFTSGATESLNTALKSCVAATPRGRLVVGSTEHKAALETSRAVADVVLVPVDGQGTPDLAEAERLVAAQRCAALVLMAVNNETGVAVDTAAVAAIGRRHGVPTIVDATQQAPRQRVDVDARGLDFVAVSAHKMGGPKGVGALVVPIDGHALTPLVHGGDQQSGRRSGTLNAPGVAGFAAAAEQLDYRRWAEVDRLVERMWLGLGERLDGDSLTWHGRRAPVRAPGFLSVRIAGVDADALVATTPSVAVATGSACTSDTPSPSHVLLTMGVRRGEADESIRITPGPGLTVELADAAVEAITASAQRIRSMGEPR